MKPERGPKSAAPYWKSTFAPALAAFILAFVIFGGCVEGPPDDTPSTAQWTQVLHRDAEIHWMVIIDGWLVWREWTGSDADGSLTATLWAFDLEDQTLERVASAPNMNGPIGCGDEVAYSISSPGVEGSSEAYAWQPGSTAYRLSGGDWLMQCDDDWRGFLYAYEEDGLEWYDYDIVWDSGETAAFHGEPSSTVLGNIGGRPFFSASATGGTAFYEIHSNGLLAHVASVPEQVNAFSGDGLAASFLGGPSGAPQAMYGLIWPEGRPTRINADLWASPLSVAWDGRIVLYEELMDASAKRVRAVDPHDGSDEVWPIPHPGRSYASLVVDEHGVYVALVEAEASQADSIIYRIDASI